VLELLLPHIRFNFIAVNYLVEVIENDQSVMRLPIMQSLLFETYRFKVVPDSAPTLFNCARRTATAFQYFSGDYKGPALVLSDENQTVSMPAGGGWQSIRVKMPLTSQHPYCEFKLEQITNVMFGLIVGEPFTPTGYAGQYANGYTVHSADGQLYASGTGFPKGTPFSTGDRVGVAYVASQGEFRFYRNGAHAFVHTGLVKNAENVYAVVSPTGNTKIQLLNSYDLPADLGLPTGGKFRSRKDRLPLPAPPQLDVQPPPVLDDDWGREIELEGG